MKFLVILVNSIWTSEIVLDSGQSQNVAKIKEIYDQEAKFSREILNDTEIEGTSEMCSNQRSALGRAENRRAQAGLKIAGLKKAGWKIAGPVLIPGSNIYVIVYL